MQLVTQRLALQEFEWSDLEDFHKLNSRPEVDEFNTAGISKNLAETKERLQKIIDQQSSDPRSTYTFKISLKNSNVFIGSCGIILSLDRFKLGEIHYSILPEHWGNGYATEISKALIKVGFEKFELHKVEAGVATENEKSIRVLEKSGMIREGLRKKILPIRGEWKDNYHYAIVEDDPRDY